MTLKHLHDRNKVANEAISNIGIASMYAKAVEMANASKTHEAQRQEERLASQLGLTQQLQREAHSRMARLHSSMSYTRFPHAPPYCEPTPDHTLYTHTANTPPTHRHQTAQ